MAENSPFVTTAESSGWKRTGRFDETVKLCRNFEKGFPAQVRCVEFGKSPEGRPLLAVVVSGDGTLDPKTAKRERRPVVFFQGCIHAGESDGKDAGFAVLKELLRRNDPTPPLRKVTLVFVPIFSVDGHERFGKHNRPNQIGPEEMGWRTTAQNLNLNRDYMKAEGPEMQAMLRYLQAWDPLVYLDLHVTDGAQFQHAIAVMVQPLNSGDTPIRDAGESLSRELMKRLEPHLPLPYYPSFVKEDDPASGVEVGVAPPRFSQSYWALQNRLGVLVETHSWKDYGARVKATIDTLLNTIDLVGAEGKDWLRLAEKSDQAASRLGGKEVVLAYENTKKSHQTDFRGYRYKREKSEVSGDLMTAYDPTKPEVWKIPLFDELVAKVTVRAPKAGYLVPVSVAAIVSEKLKLHGIDFQRLEKPVSGSWDIYRAEEFQFAKGSFEGRQRLEIKKGRWAKEAEALLAGSLFIPIAQSRAQVLLHLLEPEGPDSLLAWGFFNPYFEKKEYMEPYVAEALAREMLAKDKKLEAEFKKKLADDAEFAKDPDKRLEFFYRRHASWDNRYGRYPIFKTDKAPVTQ